MSVTRIACPRCRTVLRSAQALPPGQALRCGKCTARFRVPRRSPAIKAKPPAPRKAISPSNPTLPAARAGTRLVCPACHAVMRFPGPVPPARSIRCAKCATVFRQDRPKSLLSRGVPPKPPPRKARATQLGKPATFLTCGGCQARLKINGNIPPGLAIPCPRCKRKLPLPSNRKTKLAPRARPTTLAPPAPRTQLAPKPVVKKTQMAPKAPLKKTQLAPGARRPARFACPACKAVMALPGPVPVGRPIKCPKCKKVFRFQSKAKPRAKPAVKLAKPVPRPAAKRWPYVLALVLVLAAAGGVFWVLPGLRNYDIPADEWVEFIPQDGQCRVLFPGTPDLDDSLLRGPGLRASTKYTAIRVQETRGFTGITTGEIVKAFMLEMADWSPSSAAERYPKQRDELLGRIHGKLVHEADVTAGTLRGKEFTIQSADGEKVIGRFFQMGQRTYLLLAAGAYLEPGSGDAARFLESFQVRP